MLENARELVAASSRTLARNRQAAKRLLHCDGRLYFVKPVCAHLFANSAGQV